MSRRVPFLLAFGLALFYGFAPGCSREPPHEANPGPQDAVQVERDSRLLETNFTVTAADCTISWRVFGSEVNRGVIQHRSDCALPLGEQAPLIARVLRRVMQPQGNVAQFRTLSWGRLYPDGARDATLAVRLALAAKRSPQWDAARGQPRSGDINGFVKKLANDAAIYEELLPVFRQAGLDIRLASVEKVLVLPAQSLPFFARLRPAGVQPRDKVPFDCQAWFAVEPARPPAK